MRLLPVLALLTLTPLAAADTLHVPADFETIQAAVDAAADGDTVVVHKGTYPGTVTVSGKTNLLLRGAGKPLLDATGEDQGLTLTGCTGIEVRGLRVQGALVAGIFVDDSSEVHVHHCDVMGMKSGGWPEAAIRVGDSDHVTIERNECSFVIIGIRFYSPSAEGAGADDSVILRNTVHDLWHSGIEVFGTGNLVERNTVRESSSDGIWCDADDTLVLRNTLRQMETGITLFGGSGNVLERNTVKDADFAGILAGANATGSTLVRNRVVKSGSLQAVRLEGSDGSSDHDRVIKPPADGVAILGSGNQVTALRVVKPAAAGVNLQGADNTLSDVRVVHAGGDGILVAADGNTFADCRALHSSEDGFEVSGTNNEFTACKAKGSGSFGLNEMDGVTNTYVDCEFGSTAP